MSSWSVPFLYGMTLFKKCQTFFHQTYMRFHSAMATLEPQKYVISGTVGTENILLVSGRLKNFALWVEVINAKSPRRWFFDHSTKLSKQLMQLFCCVFFCQTFSLGKISSIPRDVSSVLDIMHWKSFSWTECDPLWHWAVWNYSFFSTKTFQNLRNLGAIRGIPAEFIVIYV